MSEESFDLQALRERVAARDAAGQAQGMHDGLAPIYAALDEIANAGMARREVATEEALVNAGRLWAAALQQREALAVQMQAGEQTVKIKVSEDLMHVGEYQVEKTSSHYGGWVWPHMVVDEQEKKTCWSAQATIEWLVEQLAPCVLATVEPEVALGT